MRPTPVRAHVVADDPLARAGLTAMLGAHDVEVSPVGHDVELWDDPRDLGRASRPVVALLRDSSRAGALLGEGARALVARDASPGAILAAMRAAVEGLVSLDPRVAASLLPGKRPASSSRAGEGGLEEALTPRETEVLGHLANGLGNRAIAVALGISEHTVKFHVDALRTKLQARTRTEVVVAAARLGLLIL